MDLLLSWILLFGYCFIATPLGFQWGFINLEPIQVWWNLQLYQYQLRLLNNRRAALLMVLVGIWLIFEEMVLRVCLVPLLRENIPARQRLVWMGLSLLLSITLYWGSCWRIHAFFRQWRLLFLAILLEMLCILSYVLTESLWLTLLFHWLVVVIWLLPLGGRYQLQQYPNSTIEKQKIFAKDKSTN